MLGCCAAAWCCLLLWAAPASAKLEYANVTDQETGLLTVSPDRWEADVREGETSTFTLTLINRTGRDAKVTLRPTDTAPGEIERSVEVEAVDSFRYGAGSWVRPEVSELQLDNMQQVRLDVHVTPPANAPVGSNFGGLLVLLNNTEGGPEGTGVALNIRALVQIYPRVPGQIEHGLRITKTQVADRFVFTGNRFVVYEVELENTGNVHEPVTGEAVVSSMFGNTVTTLEVDDMLVLRGSKRRTRVLWTQPPKFGRFSTQLRLEGQTEVPAERFPAVTILPPWWWFAIVAGAIGLPAALYWHRRRSDWRQYLDEEDWDEDLLDDKSGPGHV